jgi:Co/Zn/Cd efflux system component
MMGVLLHVMGDAANNLGVMAAALVIWLTHYEGRYYADPGTSMGIGIMIILTSLPLSMFPVYMSGWTVTYREQCAIPVISY